MIWLANYSKKSPSYSGIREAFRSAFDDVTDPTQVNISHIANAISEFINFEWRSYDSPLTLPKWGRGCAKLYAEKRHGAIFRESEMFTMP